MTTDKSITQYFGVNLAELLSEKILTVFSNFDYVSYTNAILQKVNDLSYKQRIELHANELYKYLPEDYERSISILISILGEENQKETGMFTNFYWVMPIGKYVEIYGIDNFDFSMRGHWSANEG